MPARVTPIARRARSRSRTANATTLLITLALVLGLAAPVSAATEYDNPILPVIPGGGVVESCADPSVIEGATPGDAYWYMYCTTDPLNDEDRNSEGNFNFHSVPQFRSLDLVNWEYVGDAFTAANRPAWADPGALIWAPEIEYHSGTYYLFYGITNVTDPFSPADGCDSDNAIGVATSASPIGPWVDQGAPIVGPRQAGNPGDCNFFWTYDPEVFADAAGAAHYIMYGSYYGGIWGDRIVLAPGAVTVGGGLMAVAIPNRYEGAEVAYRDGFYYLFVSAANCCNGALTGYSVFVGRSTSPLGPYVDREGQSLLAARVGGTPFLSMNGNRWVGPGHNTVFIDEGGQWWTVYHAVDRFDPVFAGTTDFTKRPALLDPVDWIDGWPTVRGGLWASDEPMPGPAAQEGDVSAYAPTYRVDDTPGAKQGYASDEFTSPNLHPRWTWVRGETADWSISGGTFQMKVQAADLYQDINSASVLTTRAPQGDYIVETRVRIDQPESCCNNYVQAGLVIYGDDDNFLKLVEFSLWETIQTEFAKEVGGRYGNAVVGPPGETWTYLRIAKRTIDGEDEYTAYTSMDGLRWVRGGTWTHELGAVERIGLVAMGMGGPASPPADYTATFDYVRTSKLP